MRNFESEIDELKEEVKSLQIKNNVLTNEEELFKTRIEKSGRTNTANVNVKEKDRPTIEDCQSVPIREGDWVKVLTQGKYNRSKGKILYIKSG